MNQETQEECRRRFRDTGLLATVEVLAGCEYEPQLRKVFLRLPDEMIWASIRSASVMVQLVAALVGDTRIVLLAALEAVELAANEESAEAARMVERLRRVLLKSYKAADLQEVEFEVRSRVDRVRELGRKSWRCVTWEAINLIACAVVRFVSGRSQAGQLRSMVVSAVQATFTARVKRLEGSGVEEAEAVGQAHMDLTHEIRSVVSYELLRATLWPASAEAAC